ncbi:Sulfite exporter TauE/SafE [Pirellulimonas nuda]|uniref:Probable membrane transporter protein n=2 Tax=Pirellulimonas nuda TaxID=2528009 RepID=A0A518D6I6_9BACT|nr:Sulfite exporter TauE/SafE [Pirellulimonas nuda]
MRLWPWLLWLAAFYAVWLYLVFGQGRWADVTEHWPIALAMALGSYVAGSTPMGGGTVGFPILVLLFDLPAKLGRDFSFAVQSIGMVSAAFFILSRRQTLAWGALRGAMLGSLIGTPVGMYWIAPLIPGLWIKVLFAVVWASFGLLHLYRINEIAGRHGHATRISDGGFGMGLIVGLASGATVAAVTGVGIDMVLYGALVLLLHTDLKIAIPTSVVIMAFVSVLGITIKAATGTVTPGVYENWLAAAPVVALGAPLGALVVDLIGRKPTLLFVSVLCVGQFVWTCFHERATLGVTGVAASMAGVVVCLLGFEALRAWGNRLVERRGAAEPALAMEQA